MNKENIFILGGGVMAKKIAILCALNNINVYIWDIHVDNISNGEIEKTAKRELKLAGINNVDINNILNNITKINTFNEAANFNLLIEAVIENIDIKIDLLRNAQIYYGKNIILASNTSSLSLTKIASKLEYPEKLCGMHFFNSPIMNKLIEIVKTDFTEDNVISDCYKFVNNMDHIPILVPDMPGFIVNRLLFLVIAEAIKLVETGISVNDIDNAMRLGANHPMGPLEVADYIGLDICRDILNSLYERTGNNNYKVPKLLSNMIKNNFLGRKNKNGFKNMNIELLKDLKYE